MGMPWREWLKRVEPTLNLHCKFACLEGAERDALRAKCRRKLTGAAQHYRTGLTVNHHGARAGLL